MNECCHILILQFLACGGTILEDEAEDQSGVITSPNFNEGGLYNPNDYCLWFLKASEGKTIKIEIDFMDIENHLECNHDNLMIAEGEVNQVNNSMLHRYCNDPSEPLPERFRILRSRGSEMTLLWKSDNNIQRRGFNLTYSFIHFHTESGFSFFDFMEI